MDHTSQPAGQQQAVRDDSHLRFGVRILSGSHESQLKRGWRVSEIVCAFGNDWNSQDHVDAQCDHKAHEHIQRQGWLSKYNSEDHDCAHKDEPLDL